MKLLLFISLLLTFALPCTQGTPLAVREAKFEPDYEALLAQEPLLVETGGAKIVTAPSGRYFIAVGCTPIGEPSATERLRQIRMGRLRALKEAAEFTRGVEVVSETQLTQQTEITTQGGEKTARSVKTLDERTFLSVRAAIQAAPQIGTWQSADGKLFFYAIGTKLP